MLKLRSICLNDNVSNTTNPCSSLNNNTTAAFAHYDGSMYTSFFNANDNDNAYIGFMYGTVDSSDYASTHANINKSTILTNLETWYKNNLESYEDKLADTIWCNDKSTVSGGLGYGTNDTYYGACNRLITTKQPTLICPDDNNGGKLFKFTVSDTTNGNGNLTYKVGLLTADELAFAGYMFNENNNTVYLLENPTSEFLADGGVDIWDVIGGNGRPSGSYVGNTYGVRSSISLKQSITISGGTGTSEDPYVVN